MDSTAQNKGNYELRAVFGGNCRLGQYLSSDGQFYPPRKVNFTYYNIYYIIFHIAKCVFYCRQFAQILCRISLCVFCCNYGWQLKRKRKIFLIIIFVNEYLFNIQSIRVPVLYKTEILSRWKSVADVR